MNELTPSPVRSNGAESSRPGFGPAVALGLLTLLAILPGLFMGLHSDDWFQVRPRPLGEVLATFTGDWNQGVSGLGGFYRPMVRVAFALDGAVWGLGAAGHHLTNGLLFAAIVACLYKTGTFLFPSSRRSIVFLLAVGFLSNPLKNEGLCWVSGRTDLLATVFVGWSFHAALRALDRSSWGWLAGSLALLVGGLLSKEVAIAGCAILPLAALLVAPRGGSRGLTAALLVVPPLLGVAYLVARSSFLGGLAGYQPGLAERPVGELAGNLLVMLSALCCPWQSGLTTVYHPLAALPGLLALGIFLLVVGLRRGPVLCLLAMGVSLLPMAFIRISPPDGNRVLMLGLFFQTLLLLFIFVEGAWMRRLFPLLAPAGFLLALSLQPANIAQTRDFLLAERPNRLILDGLWDQLGEAARGDEVVIVPREGIRNGSIRILQPGESAYLAMESRWLHEVGGSSHHLADGGPTRMVLALEAPETSANLTLAPQPWMERVRDIQFNHPAEVRGDSLARVGEPAPVPHPDGTSRRFLIPIEIPPTGLDAYEVVFEPGGPGVARMILTGPSGGRWEDPGVSFPHESGGAAWFAVRPLANASEYSLTLEVGAESGPLRLHSIRMASYR